MLLDVVFGEVHANVEGFCLTKGKTLGVYNGGYIVYDSLYYASECIKQIKNTLGGMV